MYIFPYSSKSASARVIARALPARIILREGSRFRPNGQVVINWGSQDCPTQITANCTVINQPNAVEVGANKLSFFQAVERAGARDIIVPYTTDIARAREWIGDGHKVCCRKYLGASEGKGLTIAVTVDQLVTAPLYTKYIPKDQEYRVHVMNGQAFAVQRKARRLDTPDSQVNWHIRNHNNGFVFAHENVTCPEVVRNAAVACVGHAGLNFAAVDVILTKKGRARVLEANSAPGLEGWTTEQYVAAFRTHYAR